jgi:hypothetical protein
MLTRARLFINGNPLVAPLIAGLCISALMIIVDPTQLLRNQDFSIYRHAAQEISEGDLLLRTSGNIAPGWAFYLAMVYGLFGDSIIALNIAQILLFLSLIITTYFCARELLDDARARTATLLACIWPSFIFQMQNGSSLLFYSFLFLLAVFLFVRAIRRGSLWSAFVGGIIMGWAALTDVIALFIPLVFVAWGVIRLFVRSGSSRLLLDLAALLIFLCGFVGVVAPWTYRNARVFGGFSNASLIAKNEQHYLVPETLSRALHPFVAPTDSLLWRGLEKIFIFPAGLYYLDREGHFSYKKRIGELFLYGRDPALSVREYAILGTKLLLAMAHWFMLILATVGLYSLHDNEVSWLIILLCGYVALAVIGTAALSATGFDAISMPSGFLVPLTPFLLMLSACAMRTVRTGDILDV